MSAKKYWFIAGVILVGLIAISQWHAPQQVLAPLPPVRELAPANTALAPQIAPSLQQMAAFPAPPAPRPTLTSTPGALFQYIVRPMEAATWEAKLRAPTNEIHYVKIDREVAVGKTSPFWKMGGGGRLPVVLPDGQTLPVVLDTTEQHGPQRFVSTGRIEGQPGGRALFAYSDGEMSGLVEDLQHGSWELRAIEGGVAQWFKVDPTQVGPCGVSDETRDPQKLDLIARQADAAERVAAQTGAASAVTDLRIDSSLPPVAADAAPRANIRILMVYTDAVANSVSAGSIATQMDLAISILNNDLARSQVVATVSLAGTMRVPYADDDIAGDGTQNQSDALDRLAKTSDGFMDTVHAMRDQTSADLVCLTLHRRDTASAGIAYLMTRPGDVHNPTFGFSVVDFSVFTIQSIFSHEIGHNLGCAHDRENAKDSAGKLSPGAYPYSYGYRFTGLDGIQYRTIMSYAPGNRLSYFSNPDITAPNPIGRPVGIPAGQTGEADNARTIRQDAFEVASYRLSPDTPANLGKLINVSTRALVGTNDRIMIGGFIVSGSSTKTVLLRAVGPSLAQFGITDALADPVMSLVRQSDHATIDQNDNWGSLPNPASVASTMASVGAFALPNGSRDSVLIATLPAGGYTATIQGVGGASGTALVEAYEVGQNGNKLANLSTRAYADVAHPLIGGFVILADPANPTKTKRVVIRVLGPSLANFGVSGAMNDPTVELHDANGVLLLQNDDWSSGNEGDDTKPSVRIYAEQQIAAAGLAPGNRRDSAVMVDLLPGLYTAVVKPLEDLPSQPQQPGIAIVEVFEINTP